MSIRRRATVSLSRARVQMMNLSPTDTDILMLYFFLYDHTNGGVRLLIDWKLAN